MKGVIVIKELEKTSKVTPKIGLLCGIQPLKLNAYSLQTQQSALFKF
jgi:hypothetical protein